METKLLFAKVRSVKSPKRSTEFSAGIDFYIPNNFAPTLVWPKDDILIPSGIKAKLPKGYMLMGADKSGVVTTKRACIKAEREPKANAFTSSLIIGAKIIDEDYQGEIGIHLINVGPAPIMLKPGMKIAQFILVPVLYSEPLEVLEEELFKEKTVRGTGGFGSTD